MLVVAYDVRSDRRRRRLHDGLLDFGLPVQYSVFECADDAVDDVTELAERIASRRDHVRVYRLCGRCETRTHVVGEGPLPASEPGAREAVVVIGTERVAGPLEQGRAPSASRLMERVVAMPNLRAALKRVRANHGCAGVDRVDVDRFHSEAAHRLSALQRALLDGSYRAQPLRTVTIPKRSGGTRRLHIPTVRDRVAQQAVLNVLHPIWEPELEECSFAYRPGRSVRSAVHRIERLRDEGYEWVLDADLEDFFGTIDHDELLDSMRRVVRDAQLLDLIRQWITAPAASGHRITPRLRGVPQGGVISPLLSNIYLDVFDERMTALGYRLVRYADDFVVLCRSEEEAEQARVHVAEILSRLKVRLNEEKTGVTSFAAGFRFLGHLFAGGIVLPAKAAARWRIRKRGQR